MSQLVPAGHTAFPSLVQGLRLLAPLPDSEAEVLRGAIREERLTVGAHLNPETIGFVISGLLRAFDADSAGRERTQAFWGQGMLVYSLGATQARPGAPNDVLEDWTVEAIEPTHVFTLALGALDRLYCGHPCWNHIGRVFWQHAYREKLIRERYLALSATDRYLEFCRRHSGMESRIPQYLIASYVGITAVALSRLRGRKRPKRGSKS